MSKIYSVSIDLEKLVHAKIKTKKGANALVIPLDENRIFSGEKGSYLNATIFVNDEVNEYGQIGSIKQNASAPKGKKWSDLSEEEKQAIKELPYLGNISEQGGGGSSDGFEDTKEADPETDDLPF